MDRVYGVYHIHTWELTKCSNTLTHIQINTIINKLHRNTHLGTITRGEGMVLQQRAEANLSWTNVGKTGSRPGEAALQDGSHNHSEYTPEGSSSAHTRAKQVAYRNNHKLLDKAAMQHPWKENEIIEGTQRGGMDGAAQSAVKRVKKHG